MSAPATTRTAVLAPGGLPGLGHAWKLRTDPLGLFASLRAHGDIVQIRIGSQRVFVVTSTELTHELFAAKYRSFDKGVAVENFRDVFGYGLLSSEGEQHRRHRLLVQPAFHRDLLADYLAIMHERISERIDGWRDGRILDARVEMSAITLAVVAKALISARVGDELAAEVQLRLPRLLDLSYRRAVNPLPITSADSPARWSPAGPTRPTTPETSAWSSRHARPDHDRAVRSNAFRPTRPTKKNGGRGISRPVGFCEEMAKDTRPPPQPP
ncbi:cytochrome P450, partial [Nocardia wallacei]|uniref:cytochrome P450 n=1 Tax=Nocardia wallacei TaxID=480035 RepID=UPI002453A9E5